MMIRSFDPVRVLTHKGTGVTTQCYSCDSPLNSDLMPGMGGFWEVLLDSTGKMHDFKNEDVHLPYGISQEQYEMMNSLKIVLDAEKYGRHLE